MRAEGGELIRHPGYRMENGAARACSAKESLPGAPHWGLWPHLAWGHDLCHLKNLANVILTLAVKDCLPVTTQFLASLNKQQPVLEVRVPLFEA